MRGSRQFFKSRGVMHVIVFAKSGLGHICNFLKCVCVVGGGMDLPSPSKSANEVCRPKIISLHFNIIELKRLR